MEPYSSEVTRASHLITALAEGARMELKTAACVPQCAAKAAAPSNISQNIGTGCPDLTDRLVELTHSTVERTIRPIAIGSHDSLFLDQEASA